MSSGAAARLRHAILHTRAGQAVKRILRPPRAIPLLLDADPARLVEFPGDENLPIQLRDPQVLATAIASRQARLTVAAADTWRSRHTEPRMITNVLLVSHSDFTGNSALHVYRIAKELQRLGLSPAVAVPQSPAGIAELGDASFPAVTYGDATRIVFPDGRGPDVVHAFSPRELVRTLTTDLVRNFSIPYVIHLEDDDASILAADLGLADASGLRDLPLPILDDLVRPGQAHPLRARQFLELAAGATVITKRLVELVPAGVPTRVLHAGFDEAVLTPRHPRDEMRAGLGLSSDDVVVTYTGSVHSANLEDMRTLYTAVATLRRAGRPVVLVKTGTDGPEALRLPRLGAGIRDLGRVPREVIADLLHAADVLVQPGVPGAFNDFRFPSKLPEFLASGRPVVLPRANIGIEVEDGVEALVLQRGDADELARAIKRIADDPALGARLGAGGRAFALERLTWSRSGELVVDLYREISSLPCATVTELERVPLPLRVIAIARGEMTNDDVRLLGEHGIHGFALRPAQEAPDGSWVDALAEWLQQEDGDPVPFPPSTADVELYTSWIRKAVLRALARESRTVPVLFVDPGDAWSDDRRSTFLTATLAGVRDGLRQLYASRGLALDGAQLERLLR